LSKKINTQLSSSEKIDFSIDAIIDALGSKNNIKDVSSTLSSVSVLVDDISKIKESEFKKNGVQGVLRRAKKITLIFGDNAPTIKKVIDNLIGISDTIADVKDTVIEAKDKLIK
jgi:phosphotransferase system IIB component